MSVPDSTYHPRPPIRYWHLSENARVKYQNSARPYAMSVTEHTLCQYRDSGRPYTLSVPAMSVPAL
eukprot:3941081-Rhodomonas_salina.4